jgi:ABC-type cobalt transport system, ATPase component
MVEILRFKDYSFQYYNGQRLSLDKINFALDKGDFVVMIGETGSGKSTLLKQLLPIANGKSSGSIETELLRDTNHFAYVSQFVDNQLIMETPRDELKFILDNQGQSNNEIGLRIAEIASFLGIINY